MRRAVSSSSKDSCSITWHQWQAEYPMERRIGRSSARASSKASSPHAYHSTGLSACWRRYGLVSWARRFISSTPPTVARQSHPTSSGRRRKRRLGRAGEGTDWSLGPGGSSPARLQRSRGKATRPLLVGGASAASGVQEKGRTGLLGEAVHRTRL